MKGHSSLTTLMAVAVCAGLATASVDAVAQSRAELEDQIEALEKQVRALQRRVFPNRSEYFDDTGAEQTGGGQAAAGREDRALVADMSVRIAELENQIRTLTGQIEKLGFQQRRSVENFERFKADVELRLSNLEQSGLPDSGNGQAPEAAGGDDGPSGLVPTPSPEEAEALSRQRAADSARAEETSAAPPDQGESAPLPQGSLQEQYDYALSQLRRGRFDQAEAAFSAFLERYPDRELAGNAQYWLGESYYVRRDYPRAAKAFLQGYQQYGDGPKGADSLLKLGMTLAALDQPSEACAAFDELEARYPQADDRLLRLMAAERARLDCGG